MENNINKERIKRFGEITVLNIDTAIDTGIIRICNENEYIDNIVVTTDEIISLYSLASTQHYILLETKDNKFTYKDGYFEIQNSYVWFVFTKKDFMAFVNYIYELINEEAAYGE